MPGGRFMQIELCFGDSTVMIADEFPELDVLSPLSVGGTVGALAIHTDDGEIFDPFGHRWGLAQHLRDVPAEEIRAAAAAIFGGNPT